jgi:hypothetical protein
VSYPIPERAELIDREMIDNYLQTLFGRLHFKAANFINVRGIGEKGTDREGVFTEDCWAQPGVAGLGEDPDELLASSVRSWAWVWAQNNVATYIVPAVLKEAVGSAQSVELFPAAMVDLDTGDTRAKAMHLVTHLGEPTMVVASGGTTDAGTPKLHLYWVFDEPCPDVGRVVDMRHAIAMKAGGDLQFGRGVDSNPFGRAHQPIRVPGSVHSKSGNPSLVVLKRYDGPVYDVDVLAEAVRRMPESPWALKVAAIPSLGFNFSVDLFAKQDIGEALTTKVHEGGEDKTRWNQFNAVAGHKIAMVRKGEVSLDDARIELHGWVLEMMRPPWPPARVDREWRALLNRDEQKKGALPAAAREESRGTIVGDDDRGILKWAAHAWVKGETPKRKFIVKGLILSGKPHLLVAEGGAGKTFAMLDLCLKVSSRGEDEELEWMGQPIVGEAGTVVMFTTEDDTDELHIRLKALDRDGRIATAGNRLIIIPATNTDRGAFTLGERDKATGSIVSSAGWTELKGWIESLPDLRMVVIDTLNTTLHGEENNATVVNEYARLLQPVCGRMGAALVVTHHIRKSDPKTPIKTAEDMAQAVRGSSALPAAFRGVIGFWHCSDYGRLMPAIGEKPKAKHLWRMGVLKANNPEMLHDLVYLLRNESGGLSDVTARVSTSLVDEDAQRRAWVTAAVRKASDAGHPYIHGGKDAVGGLYARRSELHPLVRSLGRVKLAGLVDELVNAGELVTRQVEWRDTRGRTRAWPTIDVKGGRYDCKQPDRVEAGVQWDAPDWEGAWTFDTATGEVIPIGAPRMQLGG